ncbi:hypothetical protein SAMN02982927_01045 [Sporolactobacillus nakayamae]|uniref:Uncharacterized protein n=1 Tax=Sporolactobacillus nakayamae TaxID=269670 RepID=A0A1I2Q3E2_9BACL|nr:hypothetical protein SAMN02982927_01045 [Sporolactobacillus nakayamae]
MTAFSSATVQAIPFSVVNLLCERFMADYSFGMLDSKSIKVGPSLYINMPECNSCGRTIVFLEGF